MSEKKMCALCGQEPRKPDHSWGKNCYNAYYRGWKAHHREAKKRTPILENNVHNAAQTATLLVEMIEGAEEQERRKMLASRLGDQIETLTDSANEALDFLAPSD